MKKATTSKIEWYEPDDNRRRPAATLKESGVKSIGSRWETFRQDSA